MKTCTVCIAFPHRQSSWQVTLADSATVQDALEAARMQAGEMEVPWDGDVGIFGESCERGTVPRDGDRIEIYRPLRLDPKETRRARAKAAKAGRDSAGLPQNLRPSNRKE